MVIVEVAGCCINKRRRRCFFGRKANRRVRFFVVGITSPTVEREQRIAGPVYHTAHDFAHYHDNSPNVKLPYLDVIRISCHSFVSPVPCKSTGGWYLPFIQFHQICRAARTPARMGNRQRRFSPPPVDTTSRPRAPSMTTPRRIFRLGLRLEG